MRIYHMRKKTRYSVGRVLLLSTIIWILVIALYPLLGQAYIRPYGGASICGGVRGLNEDKDISKSSNLSYIDIYDVSELDLLVILKGYNLLYFEQRDCPGCKVLSPAIDRYFSSNSSAGIRLIRIHIDEIFSENQDVALKLISSYRVPGTPTLILVKDGVEIARHIGIFRGDQYEGLKSFIESAITGKSSSSGDSVIRPLSSLGIGLLAALSPCSLPMIAMFASSARLGGGFSRAIKVFTSLIAILIPASLGISIASNIGRIFGVSIYYALVTYVATVSLTWGLLTFSNREPLLSVEGKSALIFPILGMQCSFPFLLAVISMLPEEPIASLTTSLAFSIGYIAPYIGSNIFLNILGSIAQGGKWKQLTRYLQGAILTSAGIYVLATAIPHIIG
jgi:cytochrome c biogenesis protein CcdA